MTKSEKSPFFDAVFWRYIKRSLRRHFNSLRVAFEEPLPEGPFLFIANHHTWWDGFFIYALNHLCLRHDVHVMMGEEQFRRFSFFRKLGVFSINQNSLADIRAAFVYSVEVLHSSPNASLWIFPTGEMTPYGKEPAYKDGFARIAAQAGNVSVVPVTFRIEYGEKQLPDVYVLFGRARAVTGSDSTSVFHESTHELDRLTARLAQRVQRGETGGMNTLLYGRLTVSDRYARFKERMWK
jgi:1-acyl-sn-glycerol-3-phosphate acyltransferase